MVGCRTFEVARCWMGGGHGTANPFRMTDAGTYSPISALPTARGPRGTAASSPGTTDTSASLEALSAHFHGI